MKTKFFHKIVDFFDNDFVNFYFFVEIVYNVVVFSNQSNQNKLNVQIFSQIMNNQRFINDVCVSKQIDFTRKILIKCRIFVESKKHLLNFFIKSNWFDRYFRNNSFFQIAKLLFIFNWMNDDKSLCYFNASFFKQKNKARNIEWNFSIFAICLKRRIKKSTECLMKLYIIIFCDRKVRKIRKKH